MIGCISKGCMSNVKKRSTPGVRSINKFFFLIFFFSFELVFPINQEIFLNNILEKNKSFLDESYKFEVTSKEDSIEFSCKILQEIPIIFLVKIKNQNFEAQEFLDKNIKFKAQNKDAHLILENKNDRMKITINISGEIIVEHLNLRKNLIIETNGNIIFKSKNISDKSIFIKSKNIDLEGKIEAIDLNFFVTEKFNILESSEITCYESAKINSLIFYNEGKIETKNIEILTKLFLNKSKIFASENLELSVLESMDINKYFKGHKSIKGANLFDLELKKTNNYNFQNMGSGSVNINNHKGIIGAGALKIIIQDVFVNEGNVIGLNNSFLTGKIVKNFGTINISDGKIECEEIINSGKIFPQKDLIVKGTKFINFGQIDSFNGLTFNFSDSFLNESGEIFAKDNININSLKNFYNIRPRPVRNFKKNIYCSEGLINDPCKESEDVQNSKPGIILSTQGLISIKSDVIHNQASAILAKNGINFDFLNLENKIQPIYKHVCTGRNLPKCFKTGLWDCNPEIYSYNCLNNYIPSIIISNIAPIIFDVRDASKEIVKRYLCADLNGDNCNIEDYTQHVINEGQITNLKNNIKFTAEGIVEFINGLKNGTPENIKIPERHFPPQIYIENGAYQYIPKNMNLKFMYAHPFYAVASLSNFLKIRELKDVVFISGSAKNLNFISESNNNFIFSLNNFSHNLNKNFINNSNNFGHSLNNNFIFDTSNKNSEHTTTTITTTNWRWHADPIIEAEALTRSLLEVIRLNIIPGYSDIYSQLEEFKNAGFYYALIHGTLEKIDKKVSLTSNINKEVSSSDKEILSTSKIDKKVSSSDKEIPITSNINKEILFTEVAVPLNLEEKNKLQKLIDIVEGQISPEEVKSKLEKLRSGEYILTLDWNQIQTCPYSIIYYEPSLNKNELVLKFDYHLSKKDKDLAKKFITNNLSGENFEMMAPLAKFINYGTLNFKKIFIKVQNLFNKKSYQESSQTAKDGYSYIVRTPLSGGEIIGVDIDIEVAGENAKILNEGGKIFATHKIYLYAKNGDIENKALIGSHILEWDPGDWKKLKNFSDLTFDYNPGIISGETVKIAAQTGKIINEASKIVASEKINLQGYMGILSKSLLSKNIEFSSEHSSLLTYESVVKEGVNVGLAEISTDGDLSLKSDAGKIRAEGAVFKAGGRASFKAAKGNEFVSQSIDITETKEHSNFNLFGYEHQKTQKTSTNILQTKVFAEKIIFDSDLDNFLEAVLIDSKGGSVYIAAGNNNIFKGAEEKTTIKTEGFNFGISFFGSNSLKNLLNKDFEGAIINLADEDPLLHSLNNLIKSARKGEFMGETVYAGIESLKLLLEHKNLNKNRKNAKLLIGQRLGLTDNKGRFSPTITFRLGRSKALDEYYNKRISEINSNNLNIKSGYDTLLYDGTKLNSKKINLDVGRNLEIKAGAKLEKHETSSQGISFDFNVGLDPKANFVSGLGINLINLIPTSVGLDLTKEKREKISYNNAQINSDELNIKVNKDINISGGEIESKKMEIQCEGHIDIESLQDIEKIKSSSKSINLGLNFLNGGYSNSQLDAANTENPSMIHSKELYLIAKNIILNGAFIANENSSSNSTIIANNIEYKNLKNYSHKSGFKFNLNFSKSSKKKNLLGISAIPDIGLQDELFEGTTNTTISENIDLIAQNHLYDLNRDTHKKQTALEKKQATNFRLVLPITNFQKIREYLKDLYSTKESKEKKKIKKQIEKEIENAQIIDLNTKEEKKSKQNSNNLKESNNNNSNNNNWSFKNGPGSEIINNFLNKKLS